MPGHGLRFRLITPRREKYFSASLAFENQAIDSVILSLLMMPLEISIDVKQALALIIIDNSQIIMSAISPTLHRFAELTGGAVKKPFQTGRSSVQIARLELQIEPSDAPMTALGVQTTRWPARTRQWLSQMIGASSPATRLCAPIAASAAQNIPSGVQTAESRIENVRQRLPAGRVGQACCLSRVPGAFCPGSSRRAECPLHWRQVAHLSY